MIYVFNILSTRETKSYPSGYVHTLRPSHVNKLHIAKRLTGPNQKICEYFYPAFTYTFFTIKEIQEIFQIPITTAPLT